MLTSWCFTKFDVQIGCIVVNVRGVVDPLDKAECGNFIIALTYKKSQFASPITVRRKLLAFTKGTPGINSDPSLTGVFTQRSVLISNWWV